MEKYIEEVTAEEAKKDIVTDAIVAKTGADPKVIDDMSDEDRDTLISAVANMNESLFDDIWNDEMSLLENISTLVKKMVIREASEDIIINVISKKTGMKLDEATEVFKSIRA